MSASDAAGRTLDVDCLIVGGGPAGLAAATYLGRFRRRVMVADAGASRAKQIPLIRNCPGFPDGIPGAELLQRLRAQAGRYGAQMVTASVDEVERSGSGFSAAVGDHKVSARRILLATGVMDVPPPLPQLKSGIGKGIVRLCPVCDAYEAAGQRIAVFGKGSHAVEEARFLKTYSDRVTLVLREAADLAWEERAAAAALGIAVTVAAAEAVPTSDGYRFPLAGGSNLEVDIVYPALGCEVRSALALALGAASDANGYVTTDRHQQTAVPGLYAAGDVVHALNQVAVAFGQAAIASTAIHNSLRDGDA